MKRIILMIMVISLVTISTTAFANSDEDILQNESITFIEKYLSRF